MKTFANMYIIFEGIKIDTKEMKQAEISQTVGKYKTLL